MGKEVVMPKLGLTMTKGRIVEWKKKEGDKVKAGEVIAIGETEKITFEIKAPVEGILLKIYVPEKAIVPVGQVIAYIGEPGETPPSLPEVPLVTAPQVTVPQAIKPPETKPAEVKPAEVPAVRATPRARRLALEKGIDLSTIKGSGPGGLILEEDVLREIERREKYTTTGIRVKEVIPLSPMREVIAKRMVESLQTMAQVTLMTKAVVDGLVDIRDEILKERGLRVTYTHLLVKIVATLLRKHPLLNATLEGDKIKVLDEINIGIAVAIDHGLIVPVIKSADKKSLEEIAKEADELARRAREGALTPDEVSGGTFTITNLGMYNVDCFTPIINPPEVAILGVGRIYKEPVVIGDELKIANVMCLSLTFDHRVIDGHTAAMFLKDLADVLSSKEKLKGVI